jgi:hypothetical protein
MLIAVQLVPEGTSIQEIGRGVRHIIRLCICVETLPGRPGFDSPHPNFVLRTKPFSLPSLCATPLYILTCFYVSGRCSRSGLGYHRKYLVCLVQVYLPNSQASLIPNEFNNANADCSATRIRGHFRARKSDVVCGTPPAPGSSFQMAARQSEVRLLASKLDAHARRFLLCRPCLHLRYPHTCLLPCVRPAFTIPPKLPGLPCLSPNSTCLSQVQMSELSLMLGNSPMLIP